GDDDAGERAAAAEARRQDGAHARAFTSGEANQRQRRESPRIDRAATAYRRRPETPLKAAILQPGRPDRGVNVPKTSRKNRTAAVTSVTRGCGRGTVKRTAAAQEETCHGPLDPRDPTVLDPLPRLLRDRIQRLRLLKAQPLLPPTTTPRGAAPAWRPSSLVLLRPRARRRSADLRRTLAAHHESHGQESASD